MTIKTVLKMGNPTLSALSMPVETEIFPNKELNLLIQDMLDTMRAENGAGIAAPQIGCNKRVIMFGFEESKRYPHADSIPLTILINPVITPLTTEQEEGWEGCLSVPGLRGLVPRYQQIAYEGVTPEGVKIHRIVSGFHARVVQHEYDHLEGILYPQRIKDLRYFSFEDKI